MDNKIVIIQTNQKDMAGSARHILLEVFDFSLDIRAAVKAACKEYCQTEEGRDIYNDSGKTFDWLDFINGVSNAICKKHGFEIVSSNNIEVISVDTAENLVDVADEAAVAEPEEYNGKIVHTTTTFEYSRAQIGDLVDSEVVMDAMNCMPPVNMSTLCAQLGEPYSCREDPETGNWRNTYATFRCVSGDWDKGIWEYRGNCFAGETTERGKKPIYITSDDVEQLAAPEE